MDFGSCKQKYCGKWVAGQMDCRSVTDMKDSVNCVCWVVFSDDQRCQFAKKLSLLDVISVLLTTVSETVDTGKTDSSRRFAMTEFQ